MCICVYIFIHVYFYILKYLHISICGLLIPSIGQTQQTLNDIKGVVWKTPDWVKEF